MTAPPAEGDDPRGEVLVAGFRGRTVSGAASLAAPLFEIAPGRYSVEPPGASSDPGWVMDRADLEREVGLGLLTETTGRWPRVAGGVVLYADPGFVDPGPGWLALPTPGLSRDGAALVFVAYLPCEAATSLLTRWATLLVDDAVAWIGDAETLVDLDRAVDSAWRALLCVPVRQARELWISALVARSAARRIQGEEDEERTAHELGLDLAGEELARARERVAYVAGGGKMSRHVSSEPDGSAGPDRDPG